ncbi:MAG TPA: TldD/PmbA family protein [Candidatus Eisenbacteria bacterium]|uniref:TldD/PmbA family protein n=1 Tax=Eiseniibacteriota bacterium TaxID=2212470 RepID=A0A7V2F449_UNCEI|nr:TldD/PmbA family protein [Candidatus Eisenbacteria bacterium]
MNLDEMKELAADTVEKARSLGADTAEVSLSDSREIEVSARKNRLETLTDSSSSGILITVSVDRRRTTVTSNELEPESIRALLSEALEICRFMSEDEFFGLPEAGELGYAAADLDIHDEAVAGMQADGMIRSALELERTACALDGRIIIDFAAVSNGAYREALANSIGFCEAFERTVCSIGLSCAVEDESPGGGNSGKKQSSYWISKATSLKSLESIEQVARAAVERTIRKLGAVKPKTCEAPVVFDPVTARGFLKHIAKAVNGGEIYRKSSFLVDMKGERIGSDLVNIYDDPLLPGRLGTRPFDLEGVRSRSTTVAEKGVLASYLMNSYQARKLGGRTTGNSGGSTNFYLAPGSSTPGSLVESIDEGLYLTTLIGPGANTATGDFSQGGQGIWISKGRLSHPVNEFTVAGTFQKILSGITMVADDIDWNKKVASPSFKVARMTISGT